MDDFDQACYAKPFLKEVILRLDFVPNTLNIASGVLGSISKAALRSFPILEEQEVVEQQILFNPTLADSPQGKTIKTTNYIYHGKNREKSLTIAGDLLVVQVRSYKSYDGFLKSILPILRVLEEQTPDLETHRIGFRFVNSIEIEKGDPLEWKDYINEKMLGVIDITDDRKRIKRAFNVVEYAYDDLNLKHQFGVVNPDYPAVVRRKQFILDLDCSLTGPNAITDAEGFLNSAHAVIQKHFELSITDETRKLMKKKS